MSKVLIYCALVGAMCFSIKAQKIVTGKVTNKNNRPIFGATVTEINDSSIGALTDLNGNYKLIVNDSSILQFSYLGYLNQQVAVRNQSVINVKLASSSIKLEDVVVVGYDARKESSLTSSVKQIENEQLSSKNNTNVSKSLFGEVSGVNVISTSGQPGNGARIRIRGIGSVNGNKAPLYVLDGIPFEGSLNAINQLDIASISVLKDAVATSIYGSKGANGVILIETKKGKKGKSRVEVVFKYGLNARFLPEYDVIKSPEKYIEVSYQSLFNYANILNKDSINQNNRVPFPEPNVYAYSNLFSDVTINQKYNIWSVGAANLINPINGKFNANARRKYNPGSWDDELLRAPRRTETNVNLSGGNDKFNYYSSVSYLKDLGYLKGTEFKRFSARMNMDYQPKQWLNGGVSINYSRSLRDARGQNPRENSFRFLYQIPSIYGPFERDSTGNKVVDPIYGGYKYDYGIGRSFLSGKNPIPTVKYDSRVIRTHNLNGNLYYKFKFFKNFSFLTKLGYGYFSDLYDYLDNPFYGASKNEKGRIFKGRYEKLSYTWLKKISFKKSFAKHNIEFFLAHENQLATAKYLWTRKTNLALPFVIENNNAVNYLGSSSYTRTNTLESYFGQLKYNFSNTYFLDFLFRRDGSSRYKVNKWGTFYALGGAWVMSNEEFLKNVNWLDFLKFKSSYGIIGEQNGDGSFQSYFTGYDFYNIKNLNNEISLVPTLYGTPDLTWEESEMFQVGLDVDVFKKFEITLEYYLKNTRNLIFDRKIGSSSGLSSLTVNDGLLRNTGLEFDIISHIIRNKDFNFNISLNGDFTSNKILKMPIDPESGKEKLIDFVYDRAKVKGKSVYDYYVPEFKGVNSQTGESVFAIYYVDENDDGIQNDNEQKIASLFEFKEKNPDLINKIKSSTTANYLDATVKFHENMPALPYLRGGVRFNLDYKGFDFSAQFTYQYGGYGYDVVYASLMSNARPGVYNWHKDIEKSWKKPGDKTDIPRLSAGYDRYITAPSTRFMVKSDYLSLNNFSIGYSFNKNILGNSGINKLYFWMSGDNLWLKSARDGYIPFANEVGGSGYLAFVPGTTFTVGVKIEF